MFVERDLILLFSEILNIMNKLSVLSVLPMLSLNRKLRGCFWEGLVLKHFRKFTRITDKLTNV